MRRAVPVSGHVADQPLALEALHLGLQRGDFVRVVEARHDQVTAAAEALDLLSVESHGYDRLS